MTWAMYEQLGAICARIAADPSIRVATFRGAGGEAFVAGTDIEQFSAFKGGDDGIAYEQPIDERIGQLEAPADADHRHRRRLGHRRRPGDQRRLRFPDRHTERLASAYRSPARSATACR